MPHLITHADNKPRRSTHSAALGQPPAPASQRVYSRWLSLLVLCTGFLLIVVDSTVVNVALPSIQRDLGFSQADLQWVINSYTLTFGGLLLLGGRAADLVGRRRLFVAGTVRSEEHTSELQSRQYLVCRLLLEKKTSIRPMLNNIGITQIYVLDQDKALDFYVDLLLLEIHTNADLGFMRWLTVNVLGVPDREIL